MNYFLTEEELKIRDKARQIAEENIAPIAMECDQEAKFPWEIVELLAEKDFFRILLDKEYGGFGFGTMGLVLVTEELSKACGGIALGFAGTALGLMPLLIGGSEEQKKKYLPEIASGKALAAYGLTEPDAGSDVASIKTRAEKEGDYYILNGMKHFITNGGIAKYMSVFAITDPKKGSRGASTFWVEDGTPGLSYGKKLEKLGIRGSVTGELIFEDCRVHKDNLIGREGMGFILAMKTFDNSRPGVASQALGIAQGTLDQTINFCREYKRNGHPLSSLQSIQYKLADMATEIEAARALIYSVSRAMDHGAKDLSRTSAMSKLYASDVATRVTNEAVSILGEYGVTSKYPVEKNMRDAKITQIYEGTNEIQRLIIARDIIKKAASKK
ncbi:MAG: acyl-CoA dehydrogenase family protein [bacterium]